uniref:Uncharacterized protein n=1 Tax=Megaselia scalaris TaxID=36166 RepID=T1GFG1_MEGSC
MAGSSLWTGGFGTKNYYYKGRVEIPPGPSTILSDERGWALSVIYLTLKYGAGCLVVCLFGAVSTLKL